LAFWEEAPVELGEVGRPAPKAFCMQTAYRGASSQTSNKNNTPAPDNVVAPDPDQFEEPSKLAARIRVVLHGEVSLPMGVALSLRGQDNSMSGYSICIG